MASVNLPSWLSALRTVSAAQLKAMYDAVAAALNGGLDYRNFAPRARIPSAHKVATRAWAVLDGQLLHPFVGDGTDGDPAVDAHGPSVLRWWIPKNQLNTRVGSMKVAGWSAVLLGVSNVNGQITSGNVRLVYVPAGGAAVVKATYAIANKNFGHLPVPAVAEFDVFPGDMLAVEIDDAVLYLAGWIDAFAAAVWLKTDHLP